MRLPRTDQGNKPPDESDLKETRLQRSKEVRLDLAGDKVLTQRGTFGTSQLVEKGAITLKDGRVEQRNFDGFTTPCMIDGPVAVDVHIVPSVKKPSGIGEPSVRVISPAVVNALSWLTGKRYPTLPLGTM